MIRRRLLEGAIIAIGCTFTSSAFAQVQTELCASLDGSGSISAANFTLQKDGLAGAISDPTIVPQNGSVAVAVTQFASSSQLEVTRTIIDSAATAAAVATQVSNISKLGGGTRIDLGINECASALTRGAALRSVIDISTDGESGGDPGGAADAAISAGVDVINAIGVGAGVSVTGLQEFVRPLPATEAPPYNDGFYVIVTDFQAYSDAIRDKIKAEVDPTDPKPVPALGGIGLGILAALLAAIGFRRVRGSG